MHRDLRRRNRSRPMFEPLEGRALLASLMVTNTLDSGSGSLRQAITDADAAGGASTIGFAIPGAGVHTIAAATDLPAISRPVTIDGTTQPGYAGTPVIAIDGGGRAGSVGLSIASGGIGPTIKGLAIDRFGYAGIGVTASTVTIEANSLGVDPTGALGAGNGTGLIIGGLGGDIIEPDSTVSGNVIGENGTGIYLTQDINTTISGNFIGTDAAGTAGLGNTLDGIVAAYGTSGATITGNTIANNGRFAINDQSGGGLTLSNNTTTDNGILSADLFVTASPGIVAVGTGQVVMTTYIVSNLGPAAATNVKVGVGSQYAQGPQDSFLSPSTVFQFVGATVSQGTVAPSSLLTLEQASLGTLAPGASASITVAIRTIGSGSDFLVADASSDQPTTLPLAATAGTAVLSHGTADIAVKALAPPAARAGQPEVFTFVVTNNDPTYSTDARFLVQFFQNQEYLQQGVLTSQGTVTSLASLPGIPGGPPQPYLPGVFGGDLGLLAPGASAVVTAVIIAPSSGENVSATLFADSAADNDPNLANNLAYATAQARSYPTLTGATAEPPTGPITAIAVYLDGAVNVSEAQNVANYALTLGTARVKIQSATYDKTPFFGTTHVVTLRLARALGRPTTLKLVVSGPGSPGITGTDGSKLINAGVALSLS